MQSKKHIIKLLDTGSISIKSTNSEYPFNQENQIGNDSIDLRLGEYFYTINENYNFINTLDLTGNYPKELFNKHHFTMNGYILKPQEIIFVPTLEIVNMNSSRYYGYVSGRSVYARLGLTVHCTMTKFAYGMKSIVSLQIINHSPIPLKIYPRQKLIQMEIHEIYGKYHEYKDTYSSEKEYILPKTKDKEIELYSTSEQDTIKGSSIKKVKKKQIQPEMIKKFNNYFKVKHIIEGILGGGGLVSFFTTYFINKSSFWFVILIVSFVFTIDFIYTSIVLMKGINIDER